MGTRYDVSAEPTVFITRTFDAPREMVWEAWTDPEQMMQWWGPKDYTSPFCRIDARVNGVINCCMRSPEGKDYWSKGVYQELIEFEKIVVTDSFADAQGRAVPASEYGMGDWPDELLISVSLEEEDGKTKLTLRHFGIPAGESADLCTTGWNESFDKLDAYLAAEQE